MNKQCKECSRSCLNGGTCSTANEGFVCKINIDIDEEIKRKDLEICKLMEEMEMLKTRRSMTCK